MKIVKAIALIGIISWICSKELGLFNPSIGLNLEVEKYYSLTEKKNLSLPDSENSVWIYWASWCAPCKLEMQRLAEAQIDHKRVFAINLGEPIPRIQQFLNKNKGKYPFNFIVGGVKTAKNLSVRATPTTFHLKGREVSWSREGMSLFGIFRAESLIKL